VVTSAGYTQAYKVLEPTCLTSKFVVVNLKEYCCSRIDKLHSPNCAHPCKGSVVQEYSSHLVIEMHKFRAQLIIVTYIKVNQSLYRPGQAQRFPGG